jgi:hypothetical protein
VISVVSLMVMLIYRFLMSSVISVCLLSRLNLTRWLVRFIESDVIQ